MADGPLIQVHGSRRLVQACGAPLRWLIDRRGLPGFGSGFGQMTSATLRHVHIDDLTVLIHRPIHVAPDARDLDVGLVNEPPITHGVTARAGLVDQQGRETLDQAVDGDVNNLDSSLS